MSMITAGSVQPRCARRAAIATVALLVLSAVAGAQTTERVSVSSAGAQPATGTSTGGYITPNGRFVVFQSAATTLVAGDTNSMIDVFVRDRWLGTTTRVSVPDPGVTGSPTQANKSSFLGRAGVRYCSDDGRHVVFESASSNLVNGDTNATANIDGADIFVRDRDVDADGIFDEPGVGNVKTVRVSVKTNGAQYTEFPTGLDTYGGGCHSPSISATGRFVAFESEDDNLTTGTDDGTTGSNIYWRDRDNDGLGEWDQIGPVCIIILQNGCITAEGSITRLVSKVRATNQQGDGFCRQPAISGSGQYVAFVTASNWLDFNFDLDPNGGDDNNLDDIYVRDMFPANSKSVRISYNSNEVDLISTGGGGCSEPSISQTGRYVAFTSANTGLIGAANDTNATSDVFLRDRDNDANGVFDELGSAGATNRAITTRVSLAYNSTTNVSPQISGASTSPAISANGRYIGFVTAVNNIVCFQFCFPGCVNFCSESNNVNDVYVRDYVAATTMHASLAENSTAGNGASTIPSVANDGRTVSFVSAATNLVGTDASGTTLDVYVRVPADADGDGVADDLDQCPNTVPGSPVDDSGCPPIIPGDFNRDGDVDAGPSSDFSVFFTCETRAEVLYTGNIPPGCTLTPNGQGVIAADFDGDYDVDQDDFAVFQRCYSGPNVAGNPSCAD